jgi:predicted permease
MTSAFRQDLLYSIRVLRKSPGFTAAAVLSLGFAIGANAAIFTWVDALLLKKLPVADPQSLVLFAYSNATTQNPIPALSYPAYEALRNEAHSFTAACGEFLFPASIGSGVSSEYRVAALITSNYFSTLGLRPYRGRFFAAGEQDAASRTSAVLNYDFWRRRYQNWEVGQKVRVNGKLFDVVGVAPPGFYGTQVGMTADVMVSVGAVAEVMPGSDLTDYGASLRILARLAPGVTRGQAEAEAAVVVERHNAATVAADPRMRRALLNKRLVLLPGDHGYSAIRLRLRQPIQILAIAAGLALLIACVNLTGLLLARAAGRRRELAIRLAVGASRWQVVRQLLIESVLISVGGGALGLVLAVWGAEWGLVILGHEFPTTLNLAPDARVVGFTLAASLVCALLFAIVPGLRMAREDASTALRVGGGSTSGGPAGLRATTVVIQVAAGLVLVAGAAVLVRTVANLRARNTGFQPERLIMVQLDPALEGYSRPQVSLLFDRLVEQLRQSPGASAVGTSFYPLLGSGHMEWPLWRADDPPGAQPHRFWANYADTGFYAATGTPLLAGRDFDERDSAQSAHVAILNETASRELFPHENALGKRLRITERKSDCEVIGIVGDAAYTSLREPTRATMYLPFSQLPFVVARRTLYIRTPLPPQVAVAQIRRVLHDTGANIPVLGMRTMADQIDDSLAQERTMSVVCVIFSLMALLLACTGLYGLIAYQVRSRTAEIGIRMALGAQPQQILAATLRRALAIVAAGLALGIPATFGITRLLSVIVFGVAPGDPRIVAFSAGLILLTAGTAAYFPAARAARVDPARALRNE